MDKDLLILVFNQIVSNDLSEYQAKECLVQNSDLTMAKADQWFDMIYEVLFNELIIPSKDFGAVKFRLDLSMNEAQATKIKSCIDSHLKKYPLPYMIDDEINYLNTRKDEINLLPDYISVENLEKVNLLLEIDNRLREIQ